MKKKPVIGIDLGTTNSEVAIIKDGIPTLLTIDSSPIIPSIVSIDSKGKVLVGQPARNNAVAAPEQTVSLIKRKMGNQDLIRLHDKDYTPAMISSLILKCLKQAAEEYLKESVTQAVITVPAYFNENQREATREAAELADLDVLRLINEPTSAALCYAMKEKQRELNLVYDLGGGTFDVSIVDLSHEVMEVRASHGNTELGGSDFDLMIYEKMCQHILKEHQVDISTMPAGKIRLLHAAENAKIRLSTEASVTIREEFLFEKDQFDHSFEYRITRAEFEEMIRPKIVETMGLVREALSQAHNQSKDLDRVILVGGSTQIPLVMQMLEKELNIVPQCNINPDTVVAQGAAIEAANLSGEKIGAYMVDITSHSLGVRCTDQYLTSYHDILINRNSPLPAVASRVFYKIFDETKKIEITVYQGESRDLQQCKLLGNFRLEDLTKKGKPEIFIKLELDQSALLKVTATEIGSGKSIQHVLKRMEKTDIQKSQSIADLKSVKLNVDEELEVDAVQEEKSFLEINTTEIPPELERKVQSLLAGKTLDNSSREELEQQYASAKAGDGGATEELENLVYYME